MAAVPVTVQLQMNAWHSEDLEKNRRRFVFEFQHLTEATAQYHGVKITLAEADWTLLGSPRRLTAVLVPE